MPITIALSVTNLNNSLQVGDAIYATSTSTPTNSLDPTSLATVGVNHLVGILSRIYTIGSATILNIDDSIVNPGYTPSQGDFLMFSKYDQTDGDVIGYYAQVRFLNNSLKKAELFSVGSEVIINSK